MRRFILRTFLFSIPFILGISFTNYYIDPAKIFSDSYEEKIVEIMLDSNYVTNISNYDERLVVHMMSEKITIDLDILVLGSSRTFLINQSYYPESTLFNASVSSACIQDIIINYQFFKFNNKSPKDKIIIGIDPWIFNENHGEKRWKKNELVLTNFLDQNVSKINTTTDRSYSDYLQIFSLSYFQESMKQLLSNDKQTTWPNATMQKENTTSTRLPDNSIVYNEKMRNASQADIDEKVSEYIQDGMYMIDNFNKPSENSIKLFEALIADLNDSVEIEFFMAPYHPKVYEVIKNKFIAVLETESYIKSIAESHGIKIYGSFDPAQTGLEEVHFYDAMHCKVEGVEILLGLNK